MMPALSLDYRRTGHGPGWVRAVLLVLGLATLIGVLVYERRLAGEIALREAELGHLRAQTRPRTQVRADLSPRQLEEEIQHAKDVLQRLLLPWEKMFTAIELSDDKTIALLTVQPDTEKRRVVIGGEARNLLVMLDYVRRLETSGALTHVHLTSHEIQQQDPQKPVRFMLEATWAVRP